MNCFYSPIGKMKFAIVAKSLKLGLFSMNVAHNFVNLPEVRW